MLNQLHKFKIHPYFTFSFKEKFIQTKIDMISGWRIKECGELDKTFNQLIKEKKKSPEEIEICTNDSKSIVGINENLVVCAIFIPHINKSFSFKLNPLTSSY